METQPRFSSLHTHTVFCDGKDDIEPMCRAAYEKNLCAIGFSSHAPIFEQTGIRTDWNLHEDRIEEYAREVRAARERWQGKLLVFLGFEVDYIKGLRFATDADINAVKPDYLIGSVHYAYPPNGAPPFTVDGPHEEFFNGINEGFGGDPEALMHYYYDATAEMIAIGGFDILGHPDIMKKHCVGKNLWPPENELIRQREISRAAAKAGITVEVNTGGINRGKIDDVYPSPSFLRFLHEDNVPVIITADAHRAEHVNGNYNIALQKVKNAGFVEHVLFFTEKDGKKTLEKEKIL
jgi:histidinol-phosphatase (PHP family)